MSRKIIKIGDSAGVTIPKDELKRLNLNVGDEVDVDVTPLEKPTEHDVEVVALTQKLIKRHKKALKNLADR